MKRTGAIALAVLVAVALLGVAYQSQRQELVGIASRERIGIDSRDDCYLYNGADLKAYSDNHSTAKVYIMGDTGNVGVGGTLVVTGATTLAGGIGSTGQLVAGNGLKITQNITQVSGSTILNSATVSGTLDAQGIVSSDGLNILRLNENTLVTGTLGVSGKATLASADVTGALQGGSTGLFNGAVTMASAVVTGTLQVNGVSTLAGGYSWTGEGSAGNGLLVTGNITQVSGSALLSAAVVTGTLDARGVVSSDGGDILRLNENTLVTGTLGVSDDLTVATDVAANTLSTTDAITAGGTLRSVGVAYLQSGVVTSTLSAYTLSASQNITASGALTVGTYGGFGALYTAVSSTVGITNAEVIQVGVKGVIPLSASDGGVGGAITATLNDTTSLSDGAYLGQMLILVNVDTDADLIVVKDNANTSLGKDRTLDVNDSMTVFWDGSNWRILSILDASA
jgi:hypothetical protein